MTRASTRAFATLAALVFLSQTIAVPVLADSTTNQSIETCTSHGLHLDCVRTSRVATDFDIKYDGVNDSETWNVTNGTNAPLPAAIASVQGVDMNAIMETPIAVQVNGTSIVPRSMSGVYVGVGIEFNAPVLPALEFQVNLSPKRLANGMSEFYYRSPILRPAGWQEIVNIFDDAGRLIAVGDTFTGPLIGSDFSDNREIYRFSTALFTGQNYTVKEYVRTPGDEAANHVELAMAYGQDIDGNGASFRVFPHTDQEQLVEGSDPAYWLREVYGLSQGGAYRILTGTGDWQNFTATYNVTAGASLNEFRLTLPLEATAPFELTIQWYIKEAGSTVESGSHVITNLTGEVIEQFALSGTRAAAPREYHLTFSFRGPPGELVKFPADLTPGQPQIELDAGIGVRATFFQPWVTLHELTDPSVADDSASARLTLYLVAARDLLAGVLLLAVGGLGFLGAETGIGIVIGVGATALGGALLIQGVDELGRATCSRNGQCALTADDINRLLELGAGIAACLGVAFAPGVALKAISGLLCGLLIYDAFHNATLPKIIGQIFDTIIQAIEILAQVLSELGLTTLVILLVVAGFFVGLILLFGVAGGIKFFFITFYALLAALFTDAERPSAWGPFRKVYRIYIPLWTEVVERRFLKMDVRP